MITAHAFGLALCLHGGIEPVGVPAVAPAPHERPTHVRPVSQETLDTRWAPGTPTRVRELWHRGELLMSVDRDEARGFLVATPSHGRFLVAADGLEVLCAVAPGAGTAWHGLLLGQVLPIAATLRGFEVFHAGGVSVDGQVTLICAGSGVGKSTLVASLVARGAALVADDAVAVRLTDGALIAYPGPALLHLLPDAMEGLPGSRLRAVAGPRGKQALLAPSSGEPLPVRALYLLERGQRGVGRGPREGSVGAAELLGSTLTRSVQTPERLLRQLEVCAALASCVPVRRLRMGGSAGQAAAAVWDELRGAREPLVFP